ncbi:MAG TPA: hypothetical protein VGM81_06930 [Burkholderiaceae bacterium]|jgi:hypothetical protein
MLTPRPFEARPALVPDPDMRKEATDTEEFDDDEREFPSRKKPDQKAEGVE